jgi:hypothetical protein
MEFTSRLRFPNPLSPSAIEFTASSECTITLKLYDERGNELQTIFQNRAYPAGTHQIPLDPLSLAAGKYLYRFTALGNHGEMIETKMFEQLV